MYDNTRHQDLSVLESVQSLPKEILNSIFGLKSSGLFSRLNTIKLNGQIIDIDHLNTSESSGNIDLGKDQRVSNPYIIDLATDPQVQTLGGNARLGSNPYVPILLGLSLFVLGSELGGIREPHTHHNGGELNYVIERKARFISLGPNEVKETNEIVKGQLFFVPTGYFHYSENSDCSKRGIIAAFFSNESPRFLCLA